MNTPPSCAAAPGPPAGAHGDILVWMRRMHPAPPRHPSLQGLVASPSSPQSQASAPPTPHTPPPGAAASGSLTFMSMWSVMMLRRTLENTLTPPQGQEPPPPLSPHLHEHVVGDDAGLSRVCAEGHTRKDVHVVGLRNREAEGGRGRFQRCRPALEGGGETSEGLPSTTRRQMGQGGPAVRAAGRASPHFFTPPVPDPAPCPLTCKMRDVLATLIRHSCPDPVPPINLLRDPTLIGRRGSPSRPFPPPSPGLHGTSCRPHHPHLGYAVHLAVHLHVGLGAAARENGPPVGESAMIAGGGGQWWGR